MQFLRHFIDEVHTQAFVGIVLFCAALVAVLVSTLRRADREQQRRERAEKALRRLEERLAQAERLEAVGTLASGIAHDANNLLSLVLGYADLALLKAPPQSPLAAHLCELRSATQRTAALMQQLLRVSRRQSPSLRTLDLNSVISGLEKILLRLLGTNISFTFEKEPALGAIRADSGQLEQVLLNLVVNARDAMPQGGSLIIRTENLTLHPKDAAPGRKVPHGCYVALSVKDTGCGMDESVRARLFEPFFTTKEQGRGTGLGLSTVYNIVKHAGGHVTVETALGKGSRFTVFLPRQDEAST